eukprot:6167971-Prymnesium_polylepis.1
MVGYPGNDAFLAAVFNLKMVLTLGPGMRLYEEAQTPRTKVKRWLGRGVSGSRWLSKGVKGSYKRLVEQEPSDEITAASLADAVAHVLKLKRNTVTCSLEPKFRWVKLDPAGEAPESPHVPFVASQPSIKQVGEHYYKPVLVPTRLTQPDDQIWTIEVDPLTSKDASTFRSWNEKDRNDVVREMRQAIQEKCIKLPGGEDHALELREVVVKPGLFFKESRHEPTTFAAYERCIGSAFLHKFVPGLTKELLAHTARNHEYPGLVGVLLWAVVKGDPEMVKAVLENSFKVTGTPRPELTPLKIGRSLSTQPRSGAMQARECGDPIRNALIASITSLKLSDAADDFYWKDKYKHNAHCFELWSCQLFEKCPSGTDARLLLFRDH